MEGCQGHIDIPDGPPLEALPSAWRVRRLLERRAEAAEQVEAERRRLPAEAQEQAASPDELLVGG
jgi:hypothetical protein